VISCLIAEPHTHHPPKKRLLCVISSANHQKGKRNPEGKSTYSSGLCGMAHLNLERATLGVFHDQEMGFWIDSRDWVDGVE
jgi:hypothetical protein